MTLRRAVFINFLDDNKYARPTKEYFISFLLEIYHNFYEVLLCDPVIGYSIFCRTSQTITNGIINANNTLKCDCNECQSVD